MIAMIEQVINAVTARQPVQRRCGHCNAVGHDRRTCATRFREAEERAIGYPMPIVHADNKEELKRLRELSATRIREEAVQARAQTLQESENRARERAATRIREEAVQARAQALQESENRARERAHALEGAAPQPDLDNADAAAQNVMQGWEEERQEEERLIQGLPEERREELRQGWEEERQEELRQAQALEQALEGVVEQPAFAQRRQVVPRTGRVTATENELARMVALPVLREKAVEATECPICIEDLGEVGKTVLKCGHTLCVSCFLQQMMRATVETRARECACPVCRVSYIM